MRQLLSDLMKTESPYTCEHGRPTMIVLSPADLEKLFKRRV
jgi:DNA mismatch repair protein MutL